MDQREKEKKFLEEINNNKKIIYKIVHSYCQKAENRKDLEQEIIIQLWNSFDSYDTSYKFSTYMYRISLNVAISFYRKEQKWKSNISYCDESLFNIELEENNQTSEIDNNITLLYQLIHQLDELNRAIILLYLEEKNYKEIAEILGISETNVATKINRIKQKLKNQFSER